MITKQQLQTLKEAASILAAITSNVSLQKKYISWSIRNAKSRNPAREMECHIAFFDANPQLVHEPPTTETNL